MTRSYLTPAPRPHHRRHLLASLPLALCCLAPALTGGGCVGLTAASLGTVAGIGASALSTGKDLYQLGKLDTVEMAPWVNTMGAVRGAAGDLHLKTGEREKEENGVARFEFQDDKQACVKVRLERRTETLIRVRIDVGLFGSEPTARLFLARLRARLPDASAPVPKPAAT